MISKNARYWIWITLALGYNTDKINKLYELYTDIAEFCLGGEKEWRFCGVLSNGDINKLKSIKKSEADKIMKRCEELGYSIVCIDDSVYPECLRNIYASPAVLYVSGNLPDIDNTLSIGIVGTRRASNYGTHNAYKFGYALSKCGVITVSGGALGVDCASGDTFTSGGLNVSMASMYVPEPVISLSITPKDKQAAMQMSKALNRFTKEDPTFRVYTDPESNETIIKGMGELHLEVYVERMKREYNCEVITGKPQVAYRESITTTGDFNYTHKKQTGGSGQYGRVAGFMEPDSEKDYEFVDAIKGGAIPNEYIPSCDKGFQKAMKEGSLIGAPIVGVKITINDGQYHPVDSNDNAFQIAAIGAFREGYMKAKPVILEPIMKVQMTAPTEFQGNLFGLINQRRGVIVDSTDENNTSTVNAEVPLSEMFGFSTILRSSTQGKGEFTMEFLKYGKVPNNVADELIAKHKEEKAAGKK